jgi:hypothetical protein
MIKEQVYLRFNTRNDNDNPLPWRVLTVSGEKDGITQFSQEFAAEVRFDAPVITSQDEVEAGVFKWHIKSTGYVWWQGDMCFVSQHPP